MRLKNKVVWYSLSCINNFDIMIAKYTAQIISTMRFLSWF